MTWVEIAQGTAAVTSILMMVAIGPLFKLLHKIKTNDLHHIDAKLDANHTVLSQKVDTNHAAISQKVDALAEQVEKVEEKIDSHIKWHLNRGN